METQPLLLPVARDPIFFVVSGEPERKGRPRFRIFFAKNLVTQVVALVRSGRVAEILGALRKGINVSTYTPPETAAAEQVFALLAKPHRPEKPLTGPLRVDLLFVLPIPSSWPARDKAAAVSGARWPISRPDRDNYEKLALDAMSGIFYEDDSQVCAGETRKIYGLDPRTEVRITPILEGA